MREREMGGGEREERKRGRKEVSINDTMSETMATSFFNAFPITCTCMLHNNIQHVRNPYNQVIITCWISLVSIISPPTGDGRRPGHAPFLHPRVVKVMIMVTVHTRGVRWDMGGAWVVEDLLSVLLPSRSGTHHRNWRERENVRQCFRVTNHNSGNKQARNLNL